MKPLRLGIIGTGVAARLLHWPALEQLSDRFQVVAVANRSRDKGESFAGLVGIDRSVVYTDYRELLARGDLDVVDLVLPPQLNYTVAHAAAKAGLHVICEKPIATTVAEAQAMVALPEEFGVQLLIAENFRYDNAVRKARSLIEEGAIAAPFMLSYRWMQPVPPGDEIASRPWRQKPAHAGGIMTDHGVHMIDVVRYLMGEVSEVQAFALDQRGHLGGSDSAVYNLKFESGAVGSIQWSFGVATHLETGIQMWADDGTLEISASEVRLTKPGQTDAVFSATGPSSFYNEFRDFYGALVEGTAALVTPTDALRDLETVLAAHHSSVSGEVVHLDWGHQP
jgi:predicted dehydrogenase